MRKCNIHINNDGTVSVADTTDYVGEHRATELDILLNSELINNGISYYTLRFKPGAALKNPPNCVMTSDMIPSSDISKNTLSYRLPEALTCFGSLDVQVLAHCVTDTNEVTEIIKSPVFRVLFEPSISGEDEMFAEEARGFTALIHTALAQLNLTIDEAEELCDKINDAYENGELNGPVIMPHVSEDGTLSWSNDAGLENPPPVNIKGEKGDKGDKGDKGEDGKFSDEMADEIAANTAARHIHGNKQLLDSLTESMIGTLDVYHDLPETANDGEICIYSPANVPTVADSGKLIYVDWDVFNKTFAEEDFTEFTITFFDADGSEVGYIYATSWDNGDGGYNTVFEYTKSNEQWYITFIGGVFDEESSSYIKGQTTTYFTKAPTSFTLPVFSSLESEHYNINGDVFYAPIKLMVYRNGWYEYTSAATVDVSIGYGYELPKVAKEGDLFLLAPQNTLTLADSGKKIYIDWEKFRQPSEISDPNYAAYAQIGFSGNGGSNFTIEPVRDQENSVLNLSCYFSENDSYYFGAVFINGFLDSAELDINGTTTKYYGIEELPNYFLLPQVDEEYCNEVHNNGYLFHTEYRLMKYQGGEWIGAVEIPTKISSLENDSGFITAKDIPANRIEMTESTAIISPDTDYSFGECETLTIALAEGDKSKRNEYMFSFISGATPTVLILPDSIKWANELTVETHKRYEVSILDNIGLWCAVEVNE